MKSALQRAAGLLVAAGVSALLAGCPSTLYPNEGPGQPGDKASGIAPPGSIGVCRVPLSRRPEPINPELWRNMEPCSKRTPRRYLRIGYGQIRGATAEDEAARRRVEQITGVVKTAGQIQDGNVRMLRMMRKVKREALSDPELAVRVERQSGRVYKCDYTYLLNITDKEYSVLDGGVCPAFAFDPALKRDVCLFDTSVDWAKWLTSAWSCLAFTQTVGEGRSCYRLCDYDDYCAAQVNCAAPDFDLVLCSLGVCMPNKVRGLL